MHGDFQEGAIGMIDVFVDLVQCSFSSVSRSKEVYSCESVGEYAMDDSCLVVDCRCDDVVMIF